MKHSHSHSHSSAPHAHHHCGGPHEGASNISRLLIVLIITTVYMLVEFIGGLWSNSLALLADAGHMLTDVGAIGLALFAAWFAEHPPSPQKTYGYYRLEILAAFLNGVLLALISLYIFYEAFHRMHHPAVVEGNMLTWVAVGGLVANLSSAAVLIGAGKSNLNVRAALMHVISDSLGSVGAILAGIAITVFHFVQADPIISIVIAVMVLINAWKLIQEAVNILLEASPAHLSVADIRTALHELHEVAAVHDLHVWTITSGKDALSVHVVVSDPVHFTPDLVSKVRQLLKEKFGITHLTVQLEPPDFEEDEIHF